MNNSDNRCCTQRRILISRTRSTRRPSRNTERGNWLEEQDSESRRTPPEIYAQGSFRLGTVVRPLTDKDEYDIDLVYRRDLKKESTTHKKLKCEAGEHLLAYVQAEEEKGNSAPTIDEGRRCWTLAFDDRFHMDACRQSRTPKGCWRASWSRTANFANGNSATRSAMPNGSKWRMRTRFSEQRGRVAAILNEAAERVPDWKVKTPLQRAVQLLKINRQKRFPG